VSLALMLGLMACGGGDGGVEVSSQPIQFYENCRWEYPLPGLPETGSPVRRCFFVTACSTGDVFQQTATCVACPLGQPLSQCNP
jgi:hypothetical protein